MHSSVAASLVVYVRNCASMLLLSISGMPSNLSEFTYLVSAAVTKAIELVVMALQRSEDYYSTEDLTNYRL